MDRTACGRSRTRANRRLGSRRTRNFLPVSGPPGRPPPRPRAPGGPPPVPARALRARGRPGTRRPRTTCGRPWRTSSACRNDSPGRSTRGRSAPRPPCRSRVPARSGRAGLWTAAFSTAAVSRVGLSTAGLSPAGLSADVGRARGRCHRPEPAVRPKRTATVTRGEARGPMVLLVPKPSQPPGTVPVRTGPAIPAPTSLPALIPIRTSPPTPVSPPGPTSLPGLPLHVTARTLPEVPAQPRGPALLEVPALLADPMLLGVPARLRTRTRAVEPMLPVASAG